MKNYNMILTEKQQKYQQYHLEKLINMNILQDEQILPSDQRRVIERAKFTYSSLKKTFKQKRLKIKKKNK